MSMPWSKGLSCRCPRVGLRRTSQKRYKSYYTALPRKSVLEISGPDAAKFLRGLSCRDVDLTGGGYSGFLNASGRVLHDVFIYPTPVGASTTYLIVHESPAHHPAPLGQILPPFRLRSKVKFKDVTDAWSVWAVWGEELPTSDAERSWRMGSGGAAEAVWTFPHGVPQLGLDSAEWGCWDLRAAAGPSSLGKRVLVPRGSTPSFATSSEAVREDIYHLHRISQGIPEGPDEILPGTALPLESCMDIHGGVDFRKGCYLGQELTVRTYHTGVTRKRILPIRLLSLQDPDLVVAKAMATKPLTLASPADITYHPSASSPSRKPKSAGRLLHLHETVGSVGLGLLRLEMASGCWAGDYADRRVGDLQSSDRLIVTLDNQEWALLADKGEAYAALEASQEAHASS